MWKLRHRGEKVAHSRVIHDGDEPEWVSVVHHDGSISEVSISADDDQLMIAMWPSMSHPPHLNGGFA